MATKATQSQTNIKPSWVGIAGSIASLWLAYKQYPAFAGVWAAWYGAAWLSQPANLTGKDTMTGSPIPRGPAELKQSNRHTIWRTMRLTMFPHKTWLPATRMPLIWSAVAAAAAAAAPVDQTWMRAANATLAICAVNGTFAARRKGAAENDEAPGCKLADMPKAPKPAIIVGSAVAAIGGVAAVLFANQAHTSIPTAAIAGATPGLLIWTAAATKAAQRDWWHLIKRRREVAPYWELAKMKPGPTLTATSTVGPAIVDTYHLAGGANGIMLSPAKIDGFLPPGMRYAVLDVPNEGPNGPVAGTIHPHMFQVVAWPVDGVPDISDPELDPDVAKLALRSAVDWGWIRNGSTWSAWGDAEIVTTEGSPVVWRVTLATDMWTMYPGDVYGPSIGQASLVDTETEIGGCYVGAPFDTTEFIERQYGNMTAPQYFESVIDMNEWAAAWKAALKQGAFAPRYYPETKKEVPFVTAGGRQGVLKHAVFATNEGDGFIKFVGCEEKLRTALERGSAPFVARLGYTAANEPAGSRHTSLFRIVWSAKAGPASITDISPRSDTNAIRWIIGGMLNQAFDATRYPRPEVAGAPRCLTPKDAGEHLWAVPIRLHDGMTVAEIRAKERNFQAALRVTYMRIIEGETRDQVTLYLGCDHRNQPLERERDRPTLEALDWSKAMLEAKVLGSNGTAPTLVKIEPLPNNPQVQRIEFSLPPPLDLPTVREATEKLKTASRNAFVQIAGSNTPGNIEMLVSAEDPMPRMAPFDFDAIAGAKHVPFATSVEGEMVEFDPTESPHLLILGPTGTGKSVDIQALMFGFLVRGSHLYVADAVKGCADFRFAEDRCLAMATNVFAAAQMMKAVYAEVVRRKNMNSAAGVGSVFDLPEPPPRLVIVIDEFTSLMAPEQVPPKSDDPELAIEREAIIRINNAKGTIGALTGRVAREARSAGASLILGTQKLRQDDLNRMPGASDLKVNLARLLLGKATTGDKQSALRDPFEAPVVGDAPPKGRGLFEPLSSSCIVIQTWYSPQSKLREMLVEMVPAVNPDDQLVLPEEDPFLSQLTGDPESVWAVDEPVPGLWGNSWDNVQPADDRRSGDDAGWSDAEVWPAMLWPDGFAAGPVGETDDGFWDVALPDAADAESDVWVGDDATSWSDDAGDAGGDDGDSLWGDEPDDDFDDYDAAAATEPQPAGWGQFPPPAAAPHPPAVMWAPPTPLPPPTHTRNG